PAEPFDLSPPTPPSTPAGPGPKTPPARLPRKSPRKTTMPELKTVSDVGPDALGVTADQKQAAGGQFSHATDVLRSGGDPLYAEQLLLSSVKLDPTNLLYRKMLRELIRDHAKGRGGWFTAITTLLARNRFRAARRADDHRKALELGEELLARLPGDLPTQMEMSDSAEELDLSGLAVWLLEEARQGAGKDLGLLRALAALYERQKKFNHAIEVWEKVKELDPTDHSTGTKIKDLAASDTIARTRRG
ncbi:MAG: tetratricopeptide repeat protein, partial [Gemmataceae bacterium]